MYTAMSSAKSWHNQALGQAQAKESIDAASRYGITEAIKRHLTAGTYVNAKGMMGVTPLHEAVRYGHKGVVELLIAEGADVNVKDKHGRTPLYYATHPDNQYASAETANLLRKHGGKTKKELEAAGK